MNRPMRVVIADDETSARRRLQQFLALEPDVDLVGQCSDGLQACQAILDLAPDLVFLDVEMPERNGLAVVAAIGVEAMPATIFATAFDHYALPAFDANAMDYLLKPFDQARFAKAMTKARAWVRAGQLSQCHAELAGLMAATQTPVPACARLLVRSGEIAHMVKTADIMYITAEGNYIRLHTPEATHQMRERMLGILEKLDPALFRRIHRSHIVNLDHVKKVLPWFGGDFLVMMADGCRLTLSRNFREGMAEFL